MSSRVTTEIAAAAVALATPSIQRLVASGVAKRYALHVVIADLNPDAEYLDQFHTSIIYEYVFGDIRDWEFDYRGIARNKALASWHFGVSSRTVLSSPDLYPLSELGNADLELYPGSIVFSDEQIIVSSSGIQDYFDEACSRIVGAFCKALLQHPESDLPRVFECLDLTTAPSSPFSGYQARNFVSG